MCEFLDLHSAGREILEQSARILTETFLSIGNHTWETVADARKEIDECLNPDYLCIACIHSHRVAGWAGLRPMYGNATWELHPLVVGLEFQGRGIGRLLLEQVEMRAAKWGITGIVLGTDDESGRTTLAQYDFSTGTISSAIDGIRNLERHPYEFYQKCGYRIIGIVPDATGPGKPDILMWKHVSDSGV